MFVDIEIPRDLEKFPMTTSMAGARFRAELNWTDSEQKFQFGSSLTENRLQPYSGEFQFGVSN